MRLGSHDFGRLDTLRPAGHLAVSVALPLIVHARDCARRTWKVLAPRNTVVPLGLLLLRACNRATELALLLISIAGCAARAISLMLVAVVSDGSRPTYLEEVRLESSTGRDI